MCLVLYLSLSGNSSGVLWTVYQTENISEAVSFHNKLSPVFHREIEIPWQLKNLTTLYAMFHNGSCQDMGPQPFSRHITYISAQLLM